MDIVECNVENTTFKMIVSNDWERNRVQTLATKEPETVRWILDTFQPGDTLLDVGANIGIYAVLAAAHRPDGTVIAVEPMAATFARLCDNALLNQLQNLHPYCVALSHRDGVGILNLASLEAASSMHSVGAAGLTEQFGHPIVLRAGVGLVTVDSLAATAGVPSLMKIDVDGGEDDVLAGAAAVLDDPRLRSILIEFNWVEGAPRESRRDEPLLRAGFRPEVEGIEYEHGSVRWRNTIYTRG